MAVDSFNQEYRFNSIRKEKVYYLCRKYEAYHCKAMLVLNNPDAVEGEVAGFHTHGSNIARAQLKLSLGMRLAKFKIILAFLSEMYWEASATRLMSQVLLLLGVK